MYFSFSFFPRPLRGKRGEIESSFIVITLTHITAKYKTLEKLSHGEACFSKHSFTENHYGIARAIQSVHEILSTDRKNIIK